MRSRESAHAIKRAAMLLRQIERGARFNHRLLRRFISLASGMRFPGAARTAIKRSEFPGASLETWTQTVMRGPSAWSPAERDLMAAMAAKWSACAFCVNMHGAAAARHMGTASVDAVLSDYHSAPISEGLKATLEFLETMMLRPKEMTEGHATAVLASGISIETLIDAIEVGVVLKLISRYARALDFADPGALNFTAPPSRRAIVAAGADIPVF
jgi:AhpD family alkylhydroperoxidase